MRSLLTDLGTFVRGVLKHWIGGITSSLIAVFVLIYEHATGSLFPWRFIIAWVTFYTVGGAFCLWRDTLKELQGVRELLNEKPLKHIEKRDLLEGLIEQGEWIINLWKNEQIEPIPVKQSNEWLEEVTAFARKHLRTDEHDFIHRSYYKARDAFAFGFDLCSRKLSDDEYQLASKVNARLLHLVQFRDEFTEND